MVYIDGDNNLEDYVVKDIETELSALGSNANVNVVALADRGPGYDTSRGDWQTTKVFYCTQGMLADAASAVADWGERDMGDPQTLKDFVTWAKTNFPATNYAARVLGPRLHVDSERLQHRATTRPAATPSTTTSRWRPCRPSAPSAWSAWDCCQRQMLEIAAELAALRQGDGRLRVVHQLGGHPVRRGDRRPPRRTRR